MRNLRSKLLATLGALIAVSCTFESNRSSEDCVAGVTLFLDYHDKNGTDHLKDYLHNTDIYLFNKADDSFIGKYSYNKAQSIDPNGIKLMLPPGNYYMVTWVNVGNRTTISPANPEKGTPASAFSLNHSSNLAPGYPTTDTIFYNRTDFQIKGDQSQVIPVPLRREVAYVHVVISGYDKTRQPRIVLDNMTNGYNFNDQVQGAVAYYAPPLQWNESDGTFTADFAVLRPLDSDDIYLRLYDNTQSGEVMSLSLTQPLQEQAISLQNDIEPELTIRLNVQPNGGLPTSRIEVWVNNWHSVVDINIDL